MSNAIAIVLVIAACAASLTGCSTPGATQAGTPVPRLDRSASYPADSGGGGGGSGGGGY